MSDQSLRHRPEREQRERLEELYALSALPEFERFRNFPVFTPRLNLARFLSHYELFKKIVETPGVIVDLGVFKGGSSFTWAKLCEIFCPTDIKKKVYGFDTFEGFPSIAPEDGVEDDRLGRTQGAYAGGDAILRELGLAQEAMNCDRHLDHIDRIEFIPGDVVLTAPQFVAERGNGLRIALLNLDLDLYEPTKVALEQFVPLMATGGIIILDQYADNTFGGETKAVDEYFLATRGKRPVIQKFPWHSNPAGYIEVDW